MVLSAQILPLVLLGKGDWLSLPQLYSSHRKGSVHRRAPKLLKFGLADSVGSPPQLLKAANSVFNSGSKAESTILKRRDPGTQSQVKQQAFIFKPASGSRFQNPSRSDWTDTEDMLFPEHLPSPRED